MKPALRSIDTGQRFVPHVFDELVTALVYAKMPSWHAVACYFDWRKHYARQQALEHLKRNPGAYRRMLDRGAVLTPDGWAIPSGPENPRVIEHEPMHLVTQAEVDQQLRIDREVMEQQRDHEYAVLAEDIAVFAIQWRAVVEGSSRHADALSRCSGHSQEREAYMVRWHGENAPKH